MWKNVLKKTKRTMARIEFHTFDPFDPISFLRILTKFKDACDNGGIYECAFTLLFIPF